MAHTIDHKEEIHQIQRDIEKRDNRHLNTGKNRLSYATKIAKSLLPDPTSFQDVSEYLLDMKTGMKVGASWGGKGGPKGAAAGAVVGGVGYPIGKRVVQEVVPTLDELLGGVFKRKQWQPALVEAGTGAVRTPTPTNVKPVTHFSMSAIPNPKSFNQGADGVYNIPKSQKGALKEKLVAEVAANKGSKRGIKHRAIIQGELDEAGKPVLRFLRWNGPKGANKSLVKHWSFSTVKAQAKAAANRAIGELGPLSHKEFRPWAKKLGYTDKQIDAYAEYVEKSVKAYEKEMLDVNKILRRKGTRREDLTTLAHNVAIEPHGIHSARNIDSQILTQNVAEGKYSGGHPAGQIATGVPHYKDKLKNWKADFIYYFDHKSRGGSGILPQKHETARHIELMIEQAAREGGSDAVDDLLELLDL